MLKKFSKLLFLLFTISIIACVSICYATDAVTTSETSESTPVTTSETTEDDTNYYGDLYIFDSNVVIDKVIYGNVYVFANNVEITGQIEGNLFVFAQKVNFNGSYVGGSIFSCANNVYYNGASTYLYSISNKLEMTYDSYVVRDVKVKATELIIKSAIGRDANLIADKINFGEGEDIPIIYGKLNYSAPKQIEIADGIVTDKDTQITYTKSSSLINILFGFGIAVLSALAIYSILNKVSPNFVNKISERKNICGLKMLKSFGIGLASILLVLLFTILLLLTVVGSKLAFILILLFAVLCLISVPVLSIVITNALKPALKIENKAKFLLVLCLVSIILYGLTIIPYAGIILGLIIKVTSIGMIIAIFLPSKELTDEEKAKIAEAKKQAKEDKEKRKQEKLEAREIKKQAKLEAKEAKKKDNTDL